MRATLNRLWDDQRGNVIIMGSVMLVTLLAGLGASVDTGRAYLIKSKLSASLDAAGLAAGTVANSRDVQEVAEKYFNANFPDGYLDTYDTVVTAVPSANNTIIELTAQTHMRNSIMQIFGHDAVTMNVSSEVTRANKGMELVLVMDNTGSMGTNGKLTTMKNAARDLVNILYGDHDTLDNFWVGLVPFSQAVNIGPARTAWVNSDSYNFGGLSWAGCVDARGSGRDQTDDPPSVAKFSRYYWNCRVSNNEWYGSNYDRDNCRVTSPLNVRSNTSTDRYGPNLNCPRPITPLKRSRSTVLSAIAAMDAVGNTHTNLGMVWGWRVLSPRWRTLWNTDDNNTLPLNYRTPLMNKVAIILTDGDNTASTTIRSAYGYPSEGKMGTTNTATMESLMDSRMATVCTRMKQQGIIIYSITFQVGSTATKNLFRNCASTPDFYFDSPSNTELQRVFRTIADSLANLRISK